MPLSQSPPSADPWYLSGTFWAIAAALIAVVAIVVGFRAARPRRSLHVTMNSSVLLLRTAPALHGRIEVRHDGRALTEPYVVIVDVVSRSSLDIAPEAFGGAPLVLEFGVPVVELLTKEADARRAGVREPKVEVAGTALHLGPALLTRRHRLSYTVLLDGKPRFDPVGQLLEVVIRKEPAPSPFTKREIVERGKWLFALALIVVVLLSFLANVGSVLDYSTRLFGP